MPDGKHFKSQSDVLTKKLIPNLVQSILTFGLMCVRALPCVHECRACVCACVHMCGVVGVRAYVHVYTLIYALRSMHNVLPFLN